MSASPPEIIVRNAQRKRRVDLDGLQPFAARALKHCLALPAVARRRRQQFDEIAIVLVSDSRIAGLHAKFMNAPGPTDVITFQHGEIFISAETAQRNARRFRTSVLDEIRLYIIHGLLHLHGFDDTTARAARAMACAQTRIVTAAQRNRKAGARPARRV